jgi:hypothetical protein
MFSMLSTKETSESMKNNEKIENIPIVLEDIVMKHKTCIHVTSANEATRREFISSVLHGVASCYDGEVKVCPEYEIWKPW